MILCLVHFCSQSNAAACYSDHTTNKPGSDTTVIPAILSLPLDSYIGKPVDSLLKQLPVDYSFRSFIPARLGYVKGVYLVYGTEELNHCTVEIFIDHFQYLTVPNYTPARNWNMVFAKMEKISFIKVIKNNTFCLYGCNDPQH